MVARDLLLPDSDKQNDLATVRVLNSPDRRMLVWHDLEAVADAGRHGATRTRAIPASPGGAESSAAFGPVIELDEGQRYRVADPFWRSRSAACETCFSLGTSVLAPQTRDALRADSATPQQLVASANARQISASLSDPSVVIGSCR